jgi:hypothetical protein
VTARRCVFDARGVQSGVVVQWTVVLVGVTCKRHICGYPASWGGGKPAMKTRNVLVCSLLAVGLADAGAVASAPA